MGHEPLFKFFRESKTGRNLCLLLAGFFLALCVSPSCRAKSLRVIEYYHTLHQHFYCTAEYVPADCVRDLAMLQQVLNGYHAESLGEWRWVIVSQAQWKGDLLELGFQTVSPALTSYVDRETLLDESLFTADAERTSELEHAFRVPWRRLLLLAITHELGHAACRDTNEVRAELFAEQLRSGHAFSCQAGGGEHVNDFGAKALLDDVNKTMLRRALQGGPK